jgi:hypothetical protein
MLDAYACQLAPCSCKDTSSSVHHSLWSHSTVCTRRSIEAGPSDARWAHTAMEPMLSRPRPIPQSFSQASSERERVPAAIPHRTCGLRCWPAVNNRPASRRRCSRTATASAQPCGLSVRSIASISPNLSAAYQQPPQRRRDARIETAGSWQFRREGR